MVSKAEMVLFFFGTIALALILGATAGTVAYNFANVKMQTRVETLEKTCRSVN